MTSAWWIAADPVSVSPDLLGPIGLLVAALTAIGILWREHLKADADDRLQRDQAIELAKAAQADARAQQDISREQAAATNRLAEAWERRNRADNERRRRGDP